MFIIYLESRSKDILLFNSDKERLVDVLMAAIKRERFFIKYRDLFGIFLTPNGLSIHLNSVFSPDKKTDEFIERMFTAVLTNTGLDGLLQVAGSETVVSPLDKHLVRYDQFGQPIYPYIKIENFKPANTRVNESILDGLVENIPENYKCTLTTEVMDNPVYVSMQPTIFFEEDNLRYWLYQQNKEIDPISKLPMFKHPISQQLMSLNDIRKNDQLSEEIKQFANQQFSQKFVEKNQRLIEKMNFYGCNEKTQENLEKAIRKAAAANDLEGLKLFAEITSELHAVDSNPDSKRNGLHWAAIKGSTQTFEYLLNQFVNPLVPDAKGKTALDYAFEYKREDIIKLIYPAYKLEMQNENNNKLQK